jgi:hypothetical protein
MSNIENEVTMLLKNKGGQDILSGTAKDEPTRMQHASTLDSPGRISRARPAPAFICERAE